MTNKVRVLTAAPLALLLAFASAACDDDEGEDSTPDAALSAPDSGARDAGASEAGAADTGATTSGG